tara:strand:+ start:320 stop:1255 length:936 start_codon:yes stop_codon:yes gene_type:complete
MKILVTGGAGNIGGSLSRKLVERSDFFIDIIDDLSTGSENKLPDKKFKNWNFFHIDVNNYENILKSIGERDYDFIFHYAAVVGVNRTLKNPKLVLNDIEGIKNILEFSKQKKVNRIFFSSSSEVYGEPVEIPQKEATTPLNSKLPYAVVKNLAESYFRTYKKEDNINYTIFRLFNTFGPLQSDDFVITKFINQAIANKDLTVYGDGSQTRTFCYIDDNIDCTIKCLLENKYINDVLNIGSDEEMSILSLAELVIKLTKSKSKIIHLPPLIEGDMSRRKPDTSKMKSVLNREIVSLEDGIIKTYNKLKNTNS